MTALSLLNSSTYELTPCGLQIAKATTRDEWEACGHALRQVEEARQWAIGDWLRDGKSHYGDGLYKRAAEITGLHRDMLRKLKSMSDKFELCARAHNLSWAHHYHAASIKCIAESDGGSLTLSDAPDEEQIATFLKKAESENWSVAQLRTAVQTHKEQQREHIRLANEPEKYSVIYADPPWQYNSGDQHGAEPQETVLDTHYPSMPLAEICRLPVRKMAAQDAVLFLWVTSPTLEEAFNVIHAWGFEYKASMVWDKVAHNVGNYVSVRHELLLICTRGRPPKVRKLVDSVYEEDRTEHSRKPAYFRELIDELYPTGNRIEMFARGELPDHWRAWGNEAAA